MKNLKDIQKKIEKEKVKFYKVGLATEVITNGNELFDFDIFTDFIHSQKINAVFGCELFDYAEDYIITEELIEEKLGKYVAEEMNDIIIEDIKKYNEKVCKVDFNIPFLYIIACLYEGKYFYTKMPVDRGFDESFLIEPEEKLKEIIINNEKNIQEKRQKRRNTIEKLKKELKEIIINDNTFLKCTNRHLRVSYIRNLLANILDEHFEPLKKFWLAETARGICQEPIDFVEIIWRELNRH